MDAEGPEGGVRGPRGGLVSLDVGDDKRQPVGKLIVDDLRASSEPLAATSYRPVAAKMEGRPPAIGGVGTG